MNAEPSFGQWLKQRRKALDLTQAELARRVPCAVITLQKIEAGKRRPSQQMAERLAEQLGIAADDHPAFVRFARLEPGAGGAWARDRGRSVPWGRSMPPRVLVAVLRPYTNLPLPPAPLIGRDRDLAAVRERLLGDANRLLTLVGPPGVGKTRLALEAGTGLLDEFGDGVYWVELAPVGDPDLVAASIAQTLGVNETAHRSFAAGLKEYLRDKHLLLVLDNFEQVVAAAPLVNELLAECPWLSILVTSRAPLRVRRERQFPVPPLAWPPELPEGSLPDVDASWDAAEWMRYSAIALFVERAQAVRPDFALIPDTAGAIATLCARLDGLPLAIELVAARIGVLTPQALLDRLDPRLMLHTDGPRDLSERQRTLHNAIDWSYALLSPEEQRLFARLGVFVGGWTLEAAENVAWEPDGRGGCRGAVTAPLPAPTDALTSLVSNSLVVQQESARGVLGLGEPRFTLLETIRVYALERLADRGEEDPVRQRHAEYYLAFAEDADRHLRTAEQQVWLDRLEIERGNLRAALAWFLEDTGDADAGLQLAGALGHFWITRSHVSEGRTWSARALERGRHASPALRGKVLFRAGMLSWPHDMPLARSQVEESLILLRQQGPSAPPRPPRVLAVESSRWPRHESARWTWELAFALTGFGVIRAYLGDCEAVQSAAEEALALFQQVQDRWGVALALVILGEAHLLRHDYPGACSRFEESLALFREIGDKWGMGTALMDWGYTDSLQGNLDAARARLEESITAHREVGERSMRSLALNILAQVLQQQGDARGDSGDARGDSGDAREYSGDYNQAAALYAESLDLLRKMGLEANAADVVYNLAYLAQSQGHFPLAARLYQDGLALFSKQGNEEGMARCRTGLAAVAAAPE